ncbi:type II toxin-antitoxin system HicA family toxin [Microbacterium sp. RURRCA19A]|uniref:type II toxin-antitoxin system HicA family toxin n=1 Tax=Microbacterium sp. RURRCA19A TaxID=1907391 RepID=UPI000955D5B5|nr:HicA toxin of toxin-antitoxin [Microbacterium sp. RURRCA19A]
MPVFSTLVRAQKTRDVLQHLSSIGWVRLRDGQGSHELWGLPDGSKRAVVPAGHREVSAGVLRQLQKAGVVLPDSWK